MKKTPHTARKIPVLSTATLLQALSELYPLDKSAPGIVMSYLKESDQYYVSIARYEEALGAGKQILTNAMGKTLEEALATLVQNWYNGTKSARELRKFAKANRRPWTGDGDRW